MTKGTHWRMFRMTPVKNTKAFSVFIGWGNTQYEPAETFSNRWGEDFLVQASCVRDRRITPMTADEAMQLLVKWRRMGFGRNYMPTGLTASFRK